MKVRVETVDGQQWVVKSAASPAETAHLGREAEQLRRAAHPGVVELGSFQAGPPVELRTRHAGRSLDEMAPLRLPSCAVSGPQWRRVLADLHDLGIVHGAIGADHILIGAEGRPVLCGFSSSGSTKEGHAGGDVIDLADTLASLLGPEAPRRLRRLLLGPGKGLRHTPSARAFAAALSQAVPDRRLPTAAAVRPPGVSVGVEARPKAPAEAASSIPGSTAPIRARGERSTPPSAPPPRRASGETARPAQGRRRCRPGRGRCCRGCRRARPRPAPGGRGDPLPFRRSGVPPGPGSHGRLRGALGHLHHRRGTPDSRPRPLAVRFWEPPRRPRPPDRAGLGVALVGRPGDDGDGGGGRPPSRSRDAARGSRGIGLRPPRGDRRPRRRHDHDPRRQPGCLRPACDR